MTMQGIVIRFVERPKSDNPEQMINWFCEVFGLTNGSGNNALEAQILKSFLEAAHNERGLTSSELRLDTDLARSTIIYHLNRFIDAGLLVKKGRKYYLRASEMQKAIAEIEYDVNREMHRMLDIAKDFDTLFQHSLRKRLPMIPEEEGVEVKIE
jgi:predicted transcriptional regulator